jgi:uncharacterized protein
MKYLLVLAIVLAVFWYWRANRRGGASREGPAGATPKSPAAATRQPQDMVQCPVCLVHLPRIDALPGPGGRLYCCAEHRLRAGS